MLLFEFFNAVREQDNTQVDWIGDLKFFIDQDDTCFIDYIYPAIMKHKKHVGNPNAYKLYMRPLKKCLNRYSDEYNVKDLDIKFPESELVDLAKVIASEQEIYIKNGDYNAAA